MADREPGNELPPTDLLVLVYGLISAWFTNPDDLLSADGSDPHSPERLAIQRAASALDASHAVKEVGDALALSGDGILKLDRTAGDAGEERLPRAEQDGNEVDLDGVQQSRVLALAGDVGAGHRHGLPAGDGSCPLDRAGHAVGDEGEGRVSVRPVVGNAVRDDQHRDPDGVAPTPALGQIEQPPPPEFRSSWAYERLREH